MAAGPTSAVFGSPTPAVDATLWVGAALFYGVGDVVTTARGIEQRGLTERSPLVRATLGPRPTFAGFGSFKTVLLGAFYVAYVGLDPGRATVVPLSLALVGSVVTAWNYWHLRDADPPE